MLGPGAATAGGNNATDAFIGGGNNFIDAGGEAGADATAADSSAWRFRPAASDEVKVAASDDENKRADKVEVAASDDDSDREGVCRCHAGAETCAAPSAGGTAEVE